MHVVALQILLSLFEYGKSDTDRILLVNDCSNTDTMVIDHFLQTVTGRLPPDPDGHGIDDQIEYAQTTNLVQTANTSYRRPCKGSHIVMTTSGRLSINRLVLPPVLATQV